MIGIAEDGLGRGVEKLINAAYGGAPEVFSEFGLVFGQMRHGCQDNLVHRSVKGSVDSRRDSGGLNGKPTESMLICGSLEVAPHGIVGPRRISGYPGDVVPIRGIRVNRNHCMVRSTAANRARARIKYASIRAFGIS